MNMILLGIGLGLLSLLPPGPVSLTLVHVGCRLGPQQALRGALGIASGDLVLGWVALMIVGAGSALPAVVVTATRGAAAVVLLGLGALVMIRPTLHEAAVGGISRPGRTLFLLTSFTPTALGAWIALLAAMPFATDSAALGRFTLGVVIASFMWHPLLGAAAARVGRRLNPAGHTMLARAGGVTMAGLGSSLMAQLLL